MRIMNAIQKSALWIFGIGVSAKALRPGNLAGMERDRPLSRKRCEFPHITVTPCWGDNKGMCVLIDF
jgi:hypothetical protein